ncbi:MAG: glutathione S-transferase family protein [Gemmatimonas sp.]
MIELYSWATGNGRRASIALEESGLPYTVHPMDLSTKVQKEPWFLDLNPYGRIPVIVDRDGPEPVVLFESGAILVYVAEKSGKLLPTSGVARAEALKWLFFQTSGVGPMAMQVHWLARERDAGKPHHNLDVYRDEVRKLYGIMDRRLAEAPYLAGEYSIADIAAYPWVFRYPQQDIELSAFPRLADWFARVGARPAVRRGMNIPPRKDGL